MKVSIEKQENNTVSLNLEIAADVAGQEYNKVIRRYNERISISGFRKGKAPRNMIERQVGQENIQRETIDRLLTGGLADAISEHQFDVISEPVVESFNFQTGEPVTVNVKLELRPEVKLGGYKGQTVEVVEYTVPDNAVELELKALSERFTSLEPVVGRPSNDKDLVVIDFAGTVNGEEIKGGTAKNYQLDIANSNFIPGFAEQLVGKNTGEEFTIDVSFPEDYHDKDLAGKPAQFAIKVNEVKEKIVPEINDELAQKVGKFDTIEALKNDVESFIKKTAETENNNRSEKAILDKIIEESQVEIPDSMINREAKVLLEELQMRVKSQGINWETFVDAQGFEALWNNTREEAAKRVKTSLVLSEISKTEDIKLSDEYFQEKVNEISALYNTDEKTIFRQFSQNPALVQSFTQQIMGQRIIDFLLENNEVKYIEGNSENISE